MIVLLVVMGIFVVAVHTTDNRSALMWIPGAMILALGFWVNIRFHREMNRVNTQYKGELNAIRKEHGMKERQLWAIYYLQAQKEVK